jgi:CBS domain containing-hemolysin-like protein
MKKFIRLVTVVAALASVGVSHALTFATVSGSPFTNQFVLTPTSTNSAAFSVSGLMAEFSALSFSVSSGPAVVATSFGTSLRAAFSDPLNTSYVLNGSTPYTLTVTGVTKAQVPGIFGLVSINTPNSTIAAVPEPETYAMLLAGLGLIGVMYRRRLTKRM